MFLISASQGSLASLPLWLFTVQASPAFVGVSEAMIIVASITEKAKRKILDFLKKAHSHFGAFLKIFLLIFGEKGLKNSKFLKEHASPLLFKK